MVAVALRPVPVMLIAGALLIGGCGDGERGGEASNAVTQALSTVAAAPRTVTAPAETKTVTAPAKTKTETVTKTVTAPAKTVTTEADSDSKVAPAAVGAAAGALAADDTGTTTVVRTVTAAASPAPELGAPEATSTDDDTEGLPAWLAALLGAAVGALGVGAIVGWRHRHHAPEPPPAA
ncbi:hypothetical protein DSM104299_01803 [Baekduia alba]|uniref:hypothetical protein n=1 Tax=Baekduia alba TaxID=2997333 RepID=UPI002341121C|nr:hypothetical protein [Baekduia alba]WCB93101.1 hypothetical protein DSM104299_01803 [Baekduia alba]